MLSDENDLYASLPSTTHWPSTVASPPAASSRPFTRVPLAVTLFLINSRSLSVSTVARKPRTPANVDASALVTAAEYVRVVESSK